MALVLFGISFLMAPFRLQYWSSDTGHIFAKTLVVAISLAAFATVFLAWVLFLVFMPKTDAFLFPGAGFKVKSWMES